MNGVQQVEFRTNNMVFGIARNISRMTRYLTLYPGDILWMGAEGAVRDMEAGDIVEIEITGIGTLRNTVEKAAE